MTYLVAFRVWVVMAALAKLSRLVYGDNTCPFTNYQILTKSMTGIRAIVIRSSVVDAARVQKSRFTSQ